jgi:hypothetical protein
MNVNLSLPLAEQCYNAAYKGSRRDAKAVLRTYGLTHRRWTPETVRARWDGAAAFLEWWHTLEPSKRPPLDDLHGCNARAFIRFLESRGLSRSTIKSYRMGASALTKALRWGGGIYTETYPPYDPFRDILPALSEHKPPQIDQTKLEVLADQRARAKLEALLTLLDLGLSTPEACTRYWSDVSLERRELVRYHHQRIEISADAIGALEKLWAALPKEGRSRNRRIFGWSADTARRWLKRIVV